MVRTAGGMKSGGSANEGTVQPEAARVTQEKRRGEEEEGWGRRQRQKCSNGQKKTIISITLGQIIKCNKNSDK